jgi:purine nucleosidase
MLDLIGRTDIPVVAGAEYPLLRRKEEIELCERTRGTVPWLGAWTPRLYHPPDQLGDVPEGKPTIKPLDEDAAISSCEWFTSIRTRSRSMPVGQ